MTSWDRLTWKEINEVCKTKESIAILPVGSVEQHGPHLPLGTDYLIADMLSSEAVERLEKEGINALKLPPLPYGLSSMWAAYPGTVTLRTETYISLLKDVILSIISSDCTNILIVNGHAGNSDALRIAARDAVEAAGKGTVSIASVWEICGDLIDDLFETPFFHADEVETSLAMALGLRIAESPSRGCEPHRKYSDRWHSLKLRVRPKAYVYRPESIDTHGDGHFGRPDLATRDKGERLKECIIEGIKGLALDLIKGRF